MLARLRHRAVDGGHDQDGAVHLRRTGDHVLHVVGVARAVDVRVMPVRRRILDVAGRDGQDLGRIAAALALRGLRDLVVGDRRLGPAARLRHHRQRRRQRRLAVVDVPDGADVAVRLLTIEFFLGHLRLSSVCPCELVVVLGRHARCERLHAAAVRRASSDRMADAAPAGALRRIFSSLPRRRCAAPRRSGRTASSTRRAPSTASAAG